VRSLLVLSARRNESGEGAAGGTGAEERARVGLTVTVYQLRGWSPLGGDKVHGV
jgi:hypothetical protein